MSPTTALTATPAPSHAAAACDAAAGPPASAARRLTGFGPTGRLQLGNLLGAVHPMLASQTAAPGTNLIALADLHALTVAHRPHEVRAYTLEQATTLLAAGVDPERTTLFVQSQVPEHHELHYLLECVAGYGEIHRMIQFKEKAQRSGAQVRLSLLTYPVLMAADILLHDTEEVPIGEDQAQHLELARTLARRFNNRYGDTFTVPTGVNAAFAGRIMDLAEPPAKMSKSSRSGAGVLYLLDPPDVLRRKINRAVTDNRGEVRHDPTHQPGVSNLLEILAACTGRPPGELATEMRSYAALKAAVTEAVIDLLAPIQRRYRELTADPPHVRGVLAVGRDRARERASGTVGRARRALGLLPV